MNVCLLLEEKEIFEFWPVRIEICLLKGLFGWRLRIGMFEGDSDASEGVVYKE